MMSLLVKCIVALLLFATPVRILGQVDTSVQRAWVDSVLLFLHDDQTLGLKTKSDLVDSVFHVSARLRDTCAQINARIIQGTYLDALGMPDSALTQLYWARGMYQGHCDSILFAGLLANLTNVYLSLGEMERLDSVCRLALAIWNPEWRDKRARFVILNNLAIAQASGEDIDAATATFHQAFREAQQDGDATYVQRALSNLGTIKGMTGDLDSAFYFLNTAAISASENADVYNLMTLLINLANVDGERGRYRNAIASLDSAYHLATQYQNKEVIVAVHSARAELYAQMHKYKDAYDYLNQYVVANSEFLDEERVKAVTEMMEKFESEKKARQIQQLEIQKLDSDLENARITAARNRFMYVGIGVLVVALGLWSRLRYVRKSRAAIQKEKDVSEGLLLNILPESVADELKTKGFADAKHYATATILFSDFKEFTAISEQLSPADLVGELNVCFKAFDEITTKYGIEKIKTIGDAYMSAGGLPDTNTATAADVVHAALDMQQFVISRKKERDALQLPAFEMRIGMHTGPVVAGIVGVKKFQYDIWGDAVNTASRMESSGEPGRVNISEDTFQLIREDPAFKCTARGRIQAKGKGEIEMYFVERA